VTEAELSKTLWDLANGVAGFAAVQGLIFAYACAKKETADVLNRKRLKFAIGVMVASIAVAQSAAIEWCRRSICVLDPHHCGLHSEASAGRILCIASIAIFSIVILYARQLFNKQPFNE
jgi:hypothetical protein